MPSSASNLSAALKRGRKAQAERGTAPTREEEPTSQPVDQTAPAKAARRRKSTARRDPDAPTPAKRPARRAAEPKTAARRDPEQAKPTSKRTDPDYKAYTLHLKITTSDALDDAIRDAKRAGKPIGDRSDVAELALEEYLARNK